MTGALADVSARERIRTDFDSTLFVEAAAGTGKTTAVVDRVVAAVAAGRVRMERLVAITFTVAAAGELRVRIREGLERAAASSAGAAERARCARAAAEVAQADIHTIHAFCARLLRTVPLEAGLPPGFETLDTLGWDLDVRERFQTWFDAVTPGTGAAEHVRRALMLGLDPSRLRDAFIELSEHWERLEPRPRWAALMPDDVLAGAATIAARIEDALSRLPACHTEDALQAHVASLHPVSQRLGSAGTVDDVLALLPALAASVNTNRGRRENWHGTSCADVKDALRGAEEAARDLLQRARTAVAAAVSSSLADCAVAYAEERRQRGVASFQDLLVRARDVVRDDASVADRLRRSFDLIVIDEFQDTDPVQVELAFRLAAEPGATGADWSALPLRPGALALVGDPKQSIYRFRGADIAMYLGVERALHGTAARVALQVNFRSAQAIVDAVNGVFGGEGGLMSEEAGATTQATYIDLVAHDAEAAGTVSTFGGIVEGKADDMWRLEAESTAAVVADMLRAGRRVDLDGERRARPCRPADICVLMPSRTNLRNLERALDDADVPYRLESSALLIATQEARDLRVILRALDDPSDQVAVVAALRTTAFGCSDVELVEWHDTGAGWSYLHALPATPARVGAAMAALRELHEDRRVLSPAALVDAIVDRRMMRAIAADGRRPHESVRHLRYIRDQVAAVARSGHTTLHDAVAHLERLAANPQYDDVATGGDDDCVHVMTVHAAKGLEFPIAVLTGFGRKPRDLPPALCADRESGAVELRLTKDFCTPGWQSLGVTEAAMQRGERRRLLYVAMTRARDHLVISLHRGAGGGGTDADDLAARLAQLAFAGEAQITAPHGAPPIEAETADMLLDPAAHRDAEEAWLRRREAALSTLSALRCTSATALAHQPDTAIDEAADDAAAQVRGRAATSLGRAVHAVLQVIDLATLCGLAAHARAQAAAEGIPDRADEVARLVENACATGTVQRAVQSRHWRELPIGAPIEGVLLEGFIDLLWEDSDGRLVVVDYKTDNIDAAQIQERMLRYRAQGAAYALLAETVTGRQVARVDFVFASLREVRSVQDVAASIGEVRALLRAAA